MTIYLGILIGYTLSLTMAYQMWGWKGFLFTFGLLLTNKLPNFYVKF